METERIRLVWVAICPRCKEPYITAAEKRAKCPVCACLASRGRCGIELPFDVRWSGVNRR